MDPKPKQHNYKKSIPENKYNPLSWIHPKAIIGDNCWIGSDVMISEHVEIGDNVSISCGVKIHDHDTSYNHATEKNIGITYYKVKIGSNTQIGSNSVIVPTDKDLTIGDNVIVGALSLVKHDIPDRHVMGGNPLRFIGDIIINSKKRGKNDTSS